MSELQIFKWRESLISSHDLFEVYASDINILMSPFDFACANFVLLSPVKSEVVWYQLTNILIVKNCFCSELQYLVVRSLQTMFSFE